jgi:hypothetical protein
MPTATEIAVKTARELALADAIIKVMALGPV